MRRITEEDFEGDHFLKKSRSRWRRDLSMGMKPVTYIKEELLFQRYFIEAPRPRIIENALSYLKIGRFDQLPDRYFACGIPFRIISRCGQSLDSEGFIAHDQERLISILWGFLRRGKWWGDGVRYFCQCPNTKTNSGEQEGRPLTKVHPRWSKEMSDTMLCGEVIQEKNIHW